MAFYFVSQKDQNKENAQKILTAPDNKEYQYVKKMAANDLVVQYNSVSKSITGVARVIGDHRVSNGQICIDVELYPFPMVLEKDLWVRELRACQGGKSPVNENLGINSRYLQKLNTTGFRYLIKELDKYEENHSLCKMILDLAERVDVLNDVVGSGDDLDDEILPDQKIFFGAPGTGKSYKVNRIAPKDDAVTFRTTFHPDYDYAQFVGSYKPKSVCDTSSVGIQDPGNLSIGDLIDIAKKMHDDEIAHPYARLGTLYYKSLKALSKSMVGAKKEICDKSGDGMDNGPELNTGIFIGEYLEENVVLKETKITYSFVPQVFAKAYVAAWNKFIAAGKKSTADNQVYLVIEEINRGNCAQIFGDLFQLLDRDEIGYSSYAIDADADFAEWIEMQLDSSAASQNDIPEEIRSGRKLRLPPNFNILATMNTSDQSLFPMDSAFKRRFDWEYVPIDFEGKDCAGYQIEVGGEKPYPWQKFVESVNEKIVSITDSEDKQLGEYFIKLNPVDNNVITKERFLGKVMFYLWNEVCKDVHKQESFFREEENGNYFTFQDLYKKDGDKKLIFFMDWITK